MTLRSKHSHNTEATMENEGFGGERDMPHIRQTACIFVASIVGLFVLAAIL
jgi:hypothetical protein